MYTLDFYGVDRRKQIEKVLQNFGYNNIADFNNFLFMLEEKNVLWNYYHSIKNDSVCFSLEFSNILQLDLKYVCKQLGYSSIKQFEKTLKALNIKYSRAQGYYRRDLWMLSLTFNYERNENKLT